jgi:hypothetical protein
MKEQSLHLKLKHTKPHNFAELHTHTLSSTPRSPLIDDVKDESTARGTVSLVACRFRSTNLTEIAMDETKKSDIYQKVKNVIFSGRGARSYM